MLQCHMGAIMFAYLTSLLSSLKRLPFPTFWVLELQGSLF